MAMDKDIKKDQSLKTNIVKGATIWSLGWILLAGVEIIFKLIKGPPPSPSVILATVIIYGILGFGIGFFTSLLFRIMKRGIIQAEVKYLSMASCIGATVSLYGFLLVNEKFLKSTSHLLRSLCNLGFILFCLSTIVVLYIIISKIIHKFHVLSFFLAFSLTIYLIMIGGTYINESLLPGAFFALNLKNILANGGIIISSIPLFFLLYLSFRFLLRSIPSTFHFKTIVVILTSILIGGTIVLYSHSGSIPIFKESSPHRATRQKTRPNVVLITMDTTRADHLSCYGYFRKTTPHLDKLAKESLLFRNAYTTDSWTLPAHASIFTGLYPSQHGAHGSMDVWIWDLGAKLSDQFTTLAEFLQKEDYRNAGVIGGPYCSSHFGLNQGFDYYNDNLINIKPDLDHFMLYKIIGKFIPLKDLAFRYGYSGTRIASQMNDIVFKWLDKNYPHPFFLFVNYFDAHGPFDAPSPYDMLYKGKNREIINNPKDGVRKINYCEREWALIQSVLSGEHNLSDEEKEHLISQYDGKISYLDFHMERLFQKLKDLKIYDQTMIIIVGDHGESFGEHRLMFHNLALYENLLRVPLIIKYPLSVQKTGIVEYQVSLVDILPEILFTLGIPIPDAIQGIPLHETGRKGIVAENYRQRYFVNLSPLRFDRDLRTIIKGDLKYIWASNGKNELFNLSKDPGELKNVLAVLPREGEEMQTALDNLLSSGTFVVPEGKLPKMDKSMREKLRALGYVD